MLPVFFCYAARDMKTSTLQAIEARCNRVSEWLGRIAGGLFLVLLLNVFYDVIMRYVFSNVSIGMQEMEWHLYATIFLIGIPYTLLHEGHVRVDVFHEKMTPRQQAWVDLVGSIIFLLPFALLVAWYGVGFTYESLELGEGSGDPGGLPFRWIIKGMIPFAFVMIANSGVALALRSLIVLRETKGEGGAGA